MVYSMAALPDEVFVHIEHLASVHLDGSVVHRKRVTRPDLTVDNAGRLWFIQSGNHACSIEPGHPDEGPLEPPETFYQVVRDSSGQLWAAESRAIPVRCISSRNNYRVTPGPPGAQITSSMPSTSTTTPPAPSGTATRMESPGSTTTIAGTSSPPIRPWIRCVPWRFTIR
jgi:hypothetical protein